MNALQLVLAIDAINDIDQAVKYYNSVSDGLGFEFANTIDRYFTKNPSRCQQLPQFVTI